MPAKYPTSFASRDRPARLALMRWLLVVAYLPAVTFLGHWPLSIDIPGTDVYVGLPLTASLHEHNHKDHCHADAGSCSDAPLTTSATVASLAQSLAFDDVDSPLIGVGTGTAAWSAQAEVAPVAPPPKWSPLS
ncbi:MAG: hypothetical protein ABI782_08090 [Anaerolineaceae bacterium]